MATSTSAFYVELYREHLEEAAFLYQQRLSLFRDSQVSWREIGQFEERLEAHIDALVVGGELALNVCRKHANADDRGEVFAALSVFCRQRRADLVSELLARVDIADAGKVRAVEDALKHELPSEWTSSCEQALSRPPGPMTPVLAKVAGYRRLPLRPQIEQALAASPDDALPSMAWALGCPDS
jgi:hypothetical protein